TAFRVSNIWFGTRRSQVRILSPRPPSPGSAGSRARPGPSSFLRMRGIVTLISLFRPSHRSHARLQPHQQTMIEFSKKVLFVGYGAVAECTLPILFKHIAVDPRNVTVIDFESKEEKLREWTGRGVRFVRDR